MSRLPLRRWLKAVAFVCWRLISSPSTRKDLTDRSFPMGIIVFVLSVALGSATSVRFQGDKGTPAGDSTGDLITVTAPASSAHSIGHAHDASPEPARPKKVAFQSTLADFRSNICYLEFNMRSSGSRDGHLTHITAIWRDRMHQWNSPICPAFQHRWIQSEYIYDHETTQPDHIQQNAFTRLYVQQSYGTCYISFVWI